MQTKYLKIPLLVTIILSLCVWAGYSEYFTGSRDHVIIAVAGPMSGADAIAGKSLHKGARLYIDALNRTGGINGRKIILQDFDDENNPELAEDKAVQIARSQALAVIGHHYSACSISAGEIYKKYGIPAITPTSTNVKVTQNNEWYFRTAFNDNLQGRFIANYAKKVLHADTASIIYGDHEYGSHLARVFEEMAGAIGLEIKYQWNFKADGKDVDSALRRITSELQLKQDAGVIFLATHASEGVRLVKLMRDFFIRNHIMVPDAFASKAFSQAFETYPKEKRIPGYYIDGIYVTTPLIFDIANEEAQNFRKVYREKYQEEPDWIAAFAYDTAMLTVEAIQHVSISGEQSPAPPIKDIRKEIRDYLANIEVADAIEGVTGLNYFDEQGDSPKPISMGIYSNKNIISALIQFQPVSSFEAIREENVLLFGGRYMYKTNVVYTGIKINEISEIDMKTLTCALDFHIWFRYQDKIDVQNIEFLNAVEPVQLGTPAEEQVKDQLTSRLYHVKARFKTDFLTRRSREYLFGNHILGFKFRHRELSRNKLVFVADVPGMGLTDEFAYLEKIRNAVEPALKTRWTMHEPRFFQDISEKNTLGSLQYIDFRMKTLEHAQFNFSLLIKKNTFTLRGRVPGESAHYVLLSNFAMLLLFTFLGRLRIVRYHSKKGWFFRVICMFLVLISAEVVLAVRLTDETEMYDLRLVTLIFDTLWWLVPAFLLRSAMEPFVWAPMKKRTGRAVPNVLRRFMAYVIYFIAFYGIVVFVFDRNINKLMATSGMIAMVIGLIIKPNISNFFAGIVINQGSAVKIGDRIKIGNFEEGKVVDITWRSTKLETGGTLLSIPNSTVSDSVVYNHNRPDDIHGSGFVLHVDPMHTPERIKKILLDAVISAEGVLKTPGPRIRFKGFTEWSADYSVGFNVRGYGKKSACNEVVWERVWAHLNLAGIAPAIKHQEIRIFQGQKSDDTLGVLGEIDIFQLFSDEAKIRLSTRMQSRHFPPDEFIVRQGDIGNSLFIVTEGVVGVWVRLEDREEYIEVVRMGAGSFFGEMALLTGEPRSATIVSVTDVYLFEITKEDIFPLLEKQPEIFNSLSKVLTERKIITESRRKSDLKEIDKIDRQTLSKNILSKIQDFFGNKNA